MQRFIDDKVNVTVTSGLLSTARPTERGPRPRQADAAAYTGELNLADFAAVDKTSQQDLLKWKSLFVGGIDVDLEPLKVDIGEVALADFYSRFIVNARRHAEPAEHPRQGSVRRVSRPRRRRRRRTSNAKPADRAAAAASEPVRGPALPPNIRIGKITLQGGNVNFSDFFIRPNFSANLTGIGGSVTEMTPEIAADLELRGKVDNTAPVEIVGRLNPLAKDLLLDIKASARDIELPPLTAVLGQVRRLRHREGQALGDGEVPHREPQAHRREQRPPGPAHLRREGREPDRHQAPGAARRRRC